MMVRASRKFGKEFWELDKSGIAGTDFARFNIAE
jgi:hypothetical protein